MLKCTDLLQYSGKLNTSPQCQGPLYTRFLLSYLSTGPLLPSCYKQWTDTLENCFRVGLGKLQSTLLSLAQEVRRKKKCKVPSYCSAFLLELYRSVNRIKNHNHLGRDFILVRLISKVRQVS